MGVHWLVSAIAAVFGSGTGAVEARTECDRVEGARTLLVGDSHTVLSGCGAPAWDVDADGGRDSGEAVRVLARTLRPSHERIVFDIGTNDVHGPSRLARNLRDVRRIADGRRIVLVTTLVRLPDVEGNVGARANRVMTRFEARHDSQVEVIDWAAAARAAGFEPTDCCHFSPAAYDRRAAFVRRASGPLA